MAQNDWLVIFLIYADLTHDTTGFKNNENTIRELNHVFNDLFHCKINDGIKVIVILNRIKYLDGSIPDPEDRISDRTFIYEFRKSSSGGRNIANHFLEPIDNKDPKTKKSKPHGADQLAFIFNAILSKLASKPKRIFFNTWDHGSVFGIFKEESTIEEIQSFHLSKPLYENTDVVLRLRFTNKIAGADSLYKILEGKNFDNQSEKLYHYAGKYFSLQRQGDNAISPALFESIKDCHSFKNNIAFFVLDNRYFVKLILDLVIEPEDIWRYFGKIERLEEFKNIFYKVETKSIDGYFEILLRYEILTNIELRDAILKSFKKIDVMLMMNCGMLNLDSILTFNKSVDWLVAPCGDIGEPAYNYLKIISLLTKNTQADKLAGNCSRTMRNSDRHLQRYRNSKIEKVEECTIRGFKISEVNDVFEKFAELVNNFNTVLRGNDRMKYFLSNARKYCYCFSLPDYNLIDIQHWLINLSANSVNHKDLNTDLEREVRNVINLIAELLEDKSISITKPHLGKKAYSPRMSEGKIVAINPTGFSMYFPNSLQDDLESSPNKNLILNSHFFTQHPEWLNFLTHVNP